MARKCNFYLDTGTDFNANVVILGVNNKPVHIDNFRFTCTAQLVYNPKVKIAIQATPVENTCGILSLYIPANITRRLPEGTYSFSVNMCYADMSDEVNRFLTVVTGNIIANQTDTHRW